MKMKLLCLNGDHDKSEIYNEYTLFLISFDAWRLLNYLKNKIHFISNLIFGIKSTFLLETLESESLQVGVFLLSVNYWRKLGK